MKVDGGCHCGKVKFTAEVDPGMVRVCHCTDCQILGGSAFTTNVPVVTGTFKVQSGDLQTYIKVADSGNKREHAFCPTCAARIYSGSVGAEPKQYSLRVGTLTQRTVLNPKQQIWCQSALDWATNIDGVEKRAKQ